jgi:protein TonB
MKRFDFLLPFLLSAGAHLALFLPGASSTDATVVFEKGVSAVALNILPSAPSRASDPTTEMPFTVRDQEVEDADDHPVVQAPNPTPPPEPFLQEAEQPPSPTKNPLPQPRAEEPKPNHPPTEKADRPPSQPNPSVESSPSPGQSSKQLKNPTANESDKRGGNDEIATADSQDTDGDLAEKGVTAPAQVVGLTKPTYPSYSRRHGEEGTAVLSIEILANGKHGKIEVISPSGYPRLDKAAVQAVERASFIPATVRGQPVSATRRIAFTFKLNDPQR